MDDIVEVGPGLGWAYRWQVQSTWEIDWDWFDEMVREDEERHAEEADRKANLLIDLDEMPATVPPPVPTTGFEKDLLEL